MSQQMQKDWTARLSASKDWCQLASLCPSFTHFVTLHLIQEFNFYSITPFDLRVCLEPKYIVIIQESYCYAPRRRITVTVAAKHLARDPTLANTDASMQEDGCTSARSSSCLTERGRHPPQETGTRSPGLVQPAIAGAAGHRRAGLRQGNYCSPSAPSREKNSTASLAGSPAGCQAKVSGPVTAVSGPDGPDDPGFVQRLQQWDETP
ncbi:hypothetical protein CH63R_11118 [Colletotrichum higginsianum IMI 349063]|uniref:Uncharacterized protein n=1 Tax=Colletotrichum higginsianum (strain IMI 349063) TaxID=759273 RepID=A0A1B7XXE2_COLHI|nr:hypothetical protein CH63R_11118 [Colletotrichum higginsianum IMI 349063]OBR04415.1 hypothetical protein CH63R_11118 [Colletotrichum higginsianum IMI 349063]